MTLNARRFLKKVTQTKNRISHTDKLSWSVAPVPFGIAPLHIRAYWMRLRFASAYGPGPPLVKWAIIGLHLGFGGPLKACRPYS